MKIPFKRNLSGGSNLRLIGRRVPKAHLDKYEYASTTSFEATTTPTVDPDSETRSVASTNSDKTVHDWPSAQVPEHAPHAEPAQVPKKKRSFKESLFCRRTRSRSLRANKKHDFTSMESPIQTPTPIDLYFGDTVISQDTSSVASSWKDTINSTLNIQSRSVKKLASPKPIAQQVSDDDSNPSDNDDPFLPSADEGSVTMDDTSVNTEEQSSYSIPRSYFLKHNPVSWGLSTGPGAANDTSSEEIIQEKHWGKEVRSRSYGSTSWIPTEEERYKIAQAFIFGEEEATDDESVETGVSMFTGTTGLTCATGDTEATQVTGGSATTGVSERSYETNETTSAFMGQANGFYCSGASVSTSRSFVTGATGETSVFSNLGVDEESASPQSRGNKRKRRVIKSKQNLLVEVFLDLRLLAEDMADEQQGCRGCFMNTCTGESDL